MNMKCRMTSTKFLPFVLRPLAQVLPAAQTSSGYSDKINSGSSHGSKSASDNSSSRSLLSILTLHSSHTNHVIIAAM
jgi:hypothetical protein